MVMSEALSDEETTILTHTYKNPDQHIAVLGPECKDQKWFASYGQKAWDVVKHLEKRGLIHVSPYPPEEYAPKGKPGTKNNPPPGLCKVELTDEGVLVARAFSGPLFSSGKS